MIFFKIHKTRLRSFLYCFILLILTSGSYSQPIINSFSPLSGPAGSSVTISGSNFSSTPANNIVYFGVVKATVSSATNTSLTVTVPNASTFQPISVTVNNLTAFSAQFFSTSFTDATPGFTSQSFEYITRVDSVESNIETTKFCIGDIDNDGKIDVVTVDRLNNTMSVYRNISTGSNPAFAPVVNFTTGLNPRACSVGDIDGDGKLDVIVSNFGDNTVSVFRNTSTSGAISMAAKIDFATAVQPSVIAVTDLDLDGKLDLVVNTVNMEGTVSILRNTSSGGTISFSPRVDLMSLGGSIEEIRTADLNGDRLPEILVPNFGSAAITIFRNTCTPGTISFAPKINITSAVNPNNLELADLDADGKMDLMVDYYLANYVSVYRNTSFGNTIAFTNPASYSIGSYTNAVISNDLDGDGKPDMAVAGSSGVSLFKNQSSTPGTIVFDAVKEVPSFFLGGQMFAADFDGDSKPDISAKGGMFRVIILQNKTTFPQIESFSPIQAGPGDTVTISGFNFTGATAVTFGGTNAASFKVENSNTIKAVVGSGSSGSISVVAPQGRGNKTGFTFIPKPIITSFTPTTGVSGTVVTITGTDLGTTNAVYFGGTPAYSFVVESATTVKAVVYEGASGHVKLIGTNGVDSVPGFVYSIPSTPVITSIAPESGPIGATVTITGQFFNSDPSLNHVYFGPVKAIVNAASNNQLTVQVPAGARYGAITVITNSRTAYSPKPFHPTFSGGDITNGSFSEFITLDAGPSPVNICISDLDGDGRNDISFAGGHFNIISVFRNSGSANNYSFENRKDFASFSAYDFLEAVDMDGNGKKDLVVSGGGVNSISVFRNNSSPGTINLTGRVDYFLGNLGSNVRQMTIGDMNVDGKPDILLLGHNTVSIIRNTGFPGNIILSPEMLHWLVGSGNKAIKTGDLDGDGKMDIAVLSGDYDSLYILRNTSTGGSLSFAPAKGYKMRGGADMYLSDLDKDGKIDIATVNTDASYRVSVWKNISTPGLLQFDTRKDLSNGNNQPVAMAIDDVDGDSKPDIISANDFIGRSLSAFKNLSTIDTIGFANEQAYSVNNNNNGVIHGFNTGDLNNDGKPEIICPSGIISNPGSIYIFKNQTNGPKIHSFTPQKGYVGTVVTITGTNFTNTTSVQFGGKAASSFTILSPTTITAVVDSGASGNVVVTTTYGSSSAPGFLYGLPPVITSFSPTAAGVNNFVVIKGSNLSWVKGVTFGGVFAYIINQSDTSLTASVGSGASGDVKVIGDVDSSSLSGFTFIPAPQVSSASPLIGTTGTIVTINGSHFEWADNVYFGSTPAQSFTIISPTQIVATVGGGGSGEVSVSSPGGGGYGPYFQYFGQPVINSFTPTTAGPGMTITISGTNLNGASSVKIGGVPAASYTVHSALSISAVVGSGASGNVEVITPGGTATLAGFNFVLNPTISSFTPANAGAGNTITITGNNLTGATAVLFGGVPATSFVVQSSTSISAVVGAGASGNVSVTTPGGTASLAGFVFVPAPTITSFTPTVSAIGVTVTITGTHFTGASSVRFGDVEAASFTVNSATSIKAVLGNGASGNVSVTTTGGTATLGGFTFLPTPTITSFTPTVGTKGTVVTITGTNLSDVQVVNFGNSPSPSVTVLNSTTITAVVGDGATGSVNVTTSGGTATLSGFTYTMPTRINDPVISNSKDLVAQPNPASGMIVIYHPGSPKKTTLQIVDMIGRPVKVIEPVRNSKQTMLSVSELKAGLYQILWTDGSKTLSRTLMIK